MYYNNKQYKIKHISFLIKYLHNLYILQFYTSLNHIF